MERRLSLKSVQLQSQNSFKQGNFNFQRLTRRNSRAPRTRRNSSGDAIRTAAYRRPIAGLLRARESKPQDSPRLAAILRSLCRTGAVRPRNRRADLKIMPGLSRNASRNAVSSPCRILSRADPPMSGCRTAARTSKSDLTLKSNLQVRINFKARL